MCILPVGSDAQCWLSLTLKDWYCLWTLYALLNNWIVCLLQVWASMWNHGLFILPVLLILWQKWLNLAELYKMVCEPDETDLDIHIPAVMLPQDAGATLEKMLSNGSSGKILFFTWIFWLSSTPHSFNLLFTITSFFCRKMKTANVIIKLLYLPMTWNHEL